MLLKTLGKKKAESEYKEIHSPSIMFFLFFGYFGIIYCLL